MKTLLPPQPSMKTNGPRFVMALLLGMAWVGLVTANLPSRAHADEVSDGYFSGIESVADAMADTETDADPNVQTVPPGPGMQLSDLFGIIVPGEEIWLNESDLRILLGDQLKKMGATGELLLRNLTGLRARFDSRNVAQVNLYFRQVPRIEIVPAAIAKNFQWVAIDIPKNLRLRLNMTTSRVEISGLGFPNETLSMRIKVPGGTIGIVPTTISMNLQTGIARIVATAMAGKLDLIATGSLSSRDGTTLQIWESLRHSIGMKLLPGFIFQKLH